MNPVIYNTVNENIIKEMQAAGLYDILQQQIARVPEGPKQIFVFEDARPDCLTFYLYHRGFLLESDNGFSSVSVLSPAACPQVVEVVRRSVMEIFDSQPRALWVESPLCKN